MRTQALRACGWMFCLALLSGCGNSSGTHDVKGTVKLKDGTPVTAGVVNLEPVDGTVSATGRIQPDGSFVIGTHDLDDGAPPGKYRVAIAGAMEPDTRTEAEHMANKGTPPKPLIHRKYNAVATSGLEVEIKPESNQLDLVVDGP